MKKISIIIRSYNESKHLPKLLFGLKKQDYKIEETILVDSGSEDNTVKIAEQAGLKIVHIDKKDFTFGRSLNFGCKNAKGEILVFISAHCYPKYQDWLRQLIKPFDNIEVGMVYGKQRGTEISNYSELQLFKKLYPSHQPNKMRWFANNANSAIRKSLFNKIQFDEHLSGCEDIDYAKKISRLNYETRYSSQATIYHIHEESFKQISNRFYREMIALKKIFEDFYIQPKNVVIIFFDFFKDIYTAIKESKISISIFCEIIKFRVAMLIAMVKANKNFEKRNNDTIFEEIYFSNKKNSDNKIKNEDLLINYEN